MVQASIGITRMQKSLDRKDKTLLPLEENGQKIQIVNLKKSTSSKDKNKHFLAEAEYIATKIDLDHISSWDKKYPAYLILGRTGSHLKRISEELHLKLGIEVGIKEQSVYDDPEVQIIFSYIQLLSNPKSNIAYRRLIGILEKEDKQRIIEEAWTNKGFENLDKYDSIKTIKKTLGNIKAI